MRFLRCKVGYGYSCDLNLDYFIFKLCFFYYDIKREEKKKKLRNLVIIRF